MSAVAAPTAALVVAAVLSAAQLESMEAALVASAVVAGGGEVTQTLVEHNRLRLWLRLLLPQPLTSCSCLVRGRRRSSLSM